MVLRPKTSAAEARFQFHRYELRIACIAERFDKQFARAVVDARQGKEGLALRTLLSTPFAFILRRHRWRHVSSDLFIAQSLLRNGTCRTSLYDKAGNSKSDRKCDHQYDAAGQTYHSILHRRQGTQYICYGDSSDSPSIQPCNNIAVDSTSFRHILPRLLQHA